MSVYEILAATAIISCAAAQCPVAAENEHLQSKSEQVSRKAIEGLSAKNLLKLDMELRLLLEDQCDLETPLDLKIHSLNKPDKLLKKLGSGTMQMLAPSNRNELIVRAKVKDIARIVALSEVKDITWLWLGFNHDPNVTVCGVAPSVLRGSHLGPGRAERHQRTTPILPEGAPIPDNE